MVGTPSRLVYYTLLKVAVTERASRTPAGRDAGRRASWPLRMSDGFNPRDTDSSGSLDVIRGQHVRVALGRCVAAVRTCAVTPPDKIGSAAGCIGGAHRASMPLSGVRGQGVCFDRNSTSCLAICMGWYGALGIVCSRCQWHSLLQGVRLATNVSGIRPGGETPRPGVPENEGSHHELGRCCSALTRETSDEPHAHARGERAASEKPSGKSNRPPDLPYPFSWL